MTGRPTILIVDDREENLFTLRKVLKVLETDIVSATSGNDALKAALDHDFALAILDVQMPMMDGYELASLLRSDEKMMHLPIIFLSAVYKEDGHVSAGYDSGAVDFITKPYNPDHIVSKVRVFLDLHNLRREAEEARQKAEEANLSKSTFLANMSHELRTPLNVIIGYNQIAMEDIAEEGLTDVIEDMQKIDEAAHHLLGLINGILDISKIESGRMEIFTEPCDVRQLCSEAAASVRPLVDKNGNELKVEIAGDVGRIRTDVTKLRQCLFNLLGNASKFTKDGTITLTVGRTVGDGRDRLEIAISDTGIGMSAEQAERLFQPFRQADASTTRKYGGTGLGLSITKSFCELLGGCVRVSSVLGEGSTFRMEIPDMGGEDNEGRAVPETGEKSAPEAGEPQLKEGSVLVVDDDPHVREIISRCLIKDGYDVTTARNGEEALNLARRVKPIAITLDVMMPGMDGWAVIKALKAEPDLESIPVIMVSIVDDKNLGYALGAREYLTKPVNKHKLMATLRACCRSSPSDATILIVEDDTPSREILVRMIREQGYRAAEAENGRVAMEYLEHNTPAMIILDLTMPVMDGFEVMAELRTKSEWRRIPVTIFTARDLTRSEMEALQGAAEKVISKKKTSLDIVLTEIQTMMRDIMREPESPRARPERKELPTTAETTA